MPKGQIVFDSRNVRVRILIFSLIGALFVFGFFAVRWQLGDMLAELTPATDPNVSDIANLARTLAPQDPRAEWLAASASTSIFSPESIDSSVLLFAETVRLSPRDFRWWIEYGRSLEAAGRLEEAEAALTQAINIAPNYAYPRWRLGNFYLRRGRTDDALRELKLATRNNSTYRNQVFALVWDYFGHDPEKVEQVAADDADVRTDLASFFVFRSEPAVALQIWNSLSDQQKAENTRVVKILAQVSWQIAAFREGVEFSRQAGIDPDATADAITNPGFELPLRTSEATFFNWKVDRTDNKADIEPDASVKHSGARSLRINFRNFTSPKLYQIWQNVAISSNTHYRLSFWIRTENFRSGGPPVVEIANASDGKVLSVSQSFPLGTNDWQQISVEFTTPDNSTGIIVRTSRGYCGETCPIVGIAWLDDLELSRVK